MTLTLATRSDTEQDARGWNLAATRGELLAYADNVLTFGGTKSGLCAAVPRPESPTLLNTAEDTKAQFTRTEYLRIAPTTSVDHRRLYGMRQDTESPNAQLERAFFGQRLPAWGVHNRTTVVLLAAVAENAWARQVWYEARHQVEHPDLL